MKTLFQILFLFFTWFNLRATPAFAKVALPLISHAVEYDVFKITAIQQAKAFENTIANTLEKTYTTTGGSKQMLVIDRSKWSPAVKIKTIMPKQL